MQRDQNILCQQVIYQAEQFINIVKVILEPVPEPTEEASEHLLPSYVTITDYAKLKGTAMKYIYPRINSGVIVLESVGMYGKLKLIDYNKYKNLQFKKNKRRVI